MLFIFGITLNSLQQDVLINDDNDTNDCKLLLLSSIEHCIWYDSIDSNPFIVTNVLLLLSVNNVMFLL